MLRGTNSAAQQRVRQQRGGLVTLARLGGEAMTAPARAGFRARFEREAREFAAAQGRTLTPAQLEEAANALMRAHMAKMTARRLEQQARRAKRDERDQLDQAAAAQDTPRRAITRASTRASAAAAVTPRAQGLQLCVGCWLEMCPERPFPPEATSMLCRTHLDAYTQAAVTAAADKR